MSDGDAYGRDSDWWGPETCGEGGYEVPYDGHPCFGGDDPAEPARTRMQGICLRARDRRLAGSEWDGSVGCLLPFIGDWFENALAVVDEARRRGFAARLVTGTARSDVDADSDSSPNTARGIYEANRAHHWAEVTGSDLGEWWTVDAAFGTANENDAMPYVDDAPPEEYSLYPDSRSFPVDELPSPAEYGVSRIAPQHRRDADD